jgi:hypothetical protein
MQIEIEEEHGDVCQGNFKRLIQRHLEQLRMRELA